MDGRVTLVTGSSSGIGRATAVRFGREGARVGVTYHSNVEGAEETARRVEAGGGAARIVRYDLGDPDSIRAAVAEIAGEWGRIDVLVNNAVEWSGGGGPDGSSLFEEAPADRWRRMIRTSLEGAYAATQQVLPHMRPGRWGRIVNISSNLAEDGLPGSGAYAAAKSGLHGLTRVLARELAPAGILANAVLPGMTLTERARRVLPATVIDAVAGETPTNRLTTPDEVASVILFLGSAANGHVNGEIVRVTGGL